MTCHGDNIVILLQLLRDESGAPNTLRQLLWNTDYSQITGKFSYFQANYWRMDVLIWINPIIHSLAKTVVLNKNEL